MSGISRSGMMTGSIICTSSTRPAAPAEGWMIYETDTNLEYVWDGSAWIPRLDVRPVFAKAVTSTGRTTTSATYVDWPTSEVLSLSFTKRYATTKLWIEGSGTFYVTGASPRATFGARVDGVDYDLGIRAINETSSHKAWSGIEDITGLAAGVYTVTLRAKTTGGTLTADTNDEHRLKVYEANA